MPAAPRHRTSPRSTLPLWLLYPLIFAAVLLSHLSLLRLPYFWDEAGYYIPAAWDFFRTGTVIPITTLNNGHPPLPSILLAAWWHLFSFTPIATRTFLCLVTAFALLAVYQLARTLLGTRAALATTLLTAVYPIWFAQTTLAHGDTFAAAFTLWGLVFYLDYVNLGGIRNFADPEAPPTPPETHHAVLAAVFFSLGALSKETGVITPLALAAWEVLAALRQRNLRAHAIWIFALLAPAVPLGAWYGYYRLRTGFAFGNPDFLRYNATANFSVHRIALCLYHRFLHLTLHMNLFVPVICALAVLLLPVIASRARLARPVLNAIAFILCVNWVAFSVLGGALLTRYLLPMYPLVLLLCVAQWQLHLRRWGWVAALSVAALATGIWINPPYAFAPEDNLTYRDMVVLHQRAASLIEHQWPQSTVLTAWPGNSELERPELGYVTRPIKTVWIPNFTPAQIDKTASQPIDFDLVFLFSTKLAPPSGHLNLAGHPTAADARYFDYREDMLPDQAAAILHAEVLWQASNHGEWVAILRLPQTSTPASH